MFPFVTHLTWCRAEERRPALRSVLKATATEGGFETQVFEDDGGGKRAIDASDGVVVIRDATGDDGLDQFTYCSLHGPGEIASPLPTPRAANLSDDGGKEAGTFACHSRHRDASLHRSTLIFWNLSQRNTDVYGNLLHKFLDKHECTHLLIRCADTVDAACLARLLKRCTVRENEAQLRCSGGVE